MTIHEMMHQVSLLSGGIYSRKDDVSSIEIYLPEKRRQIIHAKIQKFGYDNVGVFYADVGSFHPSIDATKLLELNSLLRYSRVAIHDQTIIVIATFELARTSVADCAPVLQEIGAMADELERLLFNHDIT